MIGTIDVQVYTDKDEETPACCYESNALLIKDAEQVKFKSFSTTVHKVQGMVEYKVKDDEFQIKSEKPQENTSALL